MYANGLTDRRRTNGSARARRCMKAAAGRADGPGVEGRVKRAAQSDEDARARARGGSNANAQHAGGAGGAPAARRGATQDERAILVLLR